MNKKITIVAVFAVSIMAIGGYMLSMNRDADNSSVMNDSSLPIELVSSDHKGEAERLALYKKNVEYVKGLLDKASINYGTQELGNEGTCFVFSVEQYDSITCILLVTAETAECNAYHPVEDLKHISELAEFVVRANMTAAYGGLELDYDTGRVGYNFCIPVSSLRADEKELLNSLLYLPVARMHQYMPLVNAIRAGSKTPKEAAESVE